MKFALSCYWRRSTDMVACYYFNGASWRRRSGPDQPLDSTPEEALKKRKAPSATTDPHRGGEPGGVQANGQTYEGLSNCPGLHRNGSCGSTAHVRQIGRNWACRPKTVHATSKSGFCERYIAPRTHNTRKHFLACGLILSPRLNNVKQIVFP